MTIDRRIVVSGMGLRSPIGNSHEEFMASLANGRSGIMAMPQWKEVAMLKTLVAGVCDIEGQEKDIPRKARRTMGRVAILSALAAQDAVADAGLTSDEIVSNRCGVSFGSTSGGTADMETYFQNIESGLGLQGIMASHYLKCMSHTCAANLGVMLGCQGPLISSCTACTSGSQGVGLAYEAIKSGKADLMIAGGAEEMHFMHAAIFDLMMATSTSYNDRPSETPRPFDANRDGLVVSEGSGCLVLEEYERARGRGANIYAEILGFGNSCSGTHLTNSDAAGIERCMLSALADAGLNAGDIQYVNAHATATEVGDHAEGVAMGSVFGDKTPISCLKGHMGHSLGASGAIEAVATILMMREGMLAPTLNLDKPDPDIPKLDLIMGDARQDKISIAMSNNFAFGGVNTSLIFRKI
jgi:3-oxoacyl-[acyl-carrier-protein] synthase II